MVLLPCSAARSAESVAALYGLQRGQNALSTGVLSAGSLGDMDIRASRLAAGMSQSELARAAQVSQPNLSAYENARRSPSPEVLARITAALAGRPGPRVERHREAIRELVAAHHGCDAKVFGSVARGDDAPGSDVDVLVEFEPEATLLDEIGLRLALEDLLQVQVDVVAVDTLRGSLRDRVLAEAVPV